MARAPKRSPVPAWESAPFELPDAQALKALSNGEAEPQQQQRALRWIVHNVCRLNRLSYQPDSDRATAFAEGRRFVGLQVMRLIQTPNEDLKSEIANRSDNG